MKTLKIVVERHEEGYVAYPVGLKGVIVGEGDTQDQALADVRSAIQFHMDTFGQESLTDLPEEVSLADVTLSA